MSTYLKTVFFALFVVLLILCVLGPVMVHNDNGGNAEANAKKSLEQTKAAIKDLAEEGLPLGEADKVLIDILGK
jgi:hypothetical protein